MNAISNPPETHPPLVDLEDSADGIIRRSIIAIGCRLIADGHTVRHAILPDLQDDLIIIANHFLMLVADNPDVDADDLIQQFDEANGFAVVDAIGDLHTQLAEFHTQFADIKLELTHD